VNAKRLTLLFLATALLISSVLTAGCSTADSASGKPDTTTETLQAGEPGSGEAIGDTKKPSLPEAPPGTIFGAQKVTQDELVDLISGKKYVDPADLELDLFYDYAKMPKLSGGKTFFLTVDENRKEGDESWGKGKLSANIDCSFAFLEGDIEPGLDNIMRDGKAVRVYVFTEETYTAPEIIFTTLPVMTIDTEKKRPISWDDVKCQFTLFTPRSSNSVAYTDESAATIRIRGASSASLPKTSLRLTLYKPDYSDTYKLPLLGMRKDDDWILYASYSDESKIRDATGWVLWSRMGGYVEERNSQGTVQVRYTEVIINGKYNGFYVFMERFDEKTLNLRDDDVLFVGKTWEQPSSSMMRKLSPETTYFGGIERKYPDEEEVKYVGSSGWDILAEYCRLIYETDGAEFARLIDKYANIENHLDYWLYLQIIMGEDNLWKNTYYAIIDGKVYCFPWDLDVTFGLGWNGGVKNYLYRNFNAVTTLYDHRCGRRIVKYYPGAANYVKNRWKELLDAGIVTADGIIEIARGFWDDLWRSGAFKRNLGRWPDTSYTEDLDYFESTMRRRIEYLDGYINSLVDAGG